MTAMTLRYFTRPRWKNSHPEDEVILRARVFDNVCRAASHVPAFELGVAQDGRFWEEIERVLPEQAEPFGNEDCGRCRKS